MYIPTKVSNKEKYQYIKDHRFYLSIFSIISFIGVAYSSYKFFTLKWELYIFIPFLIFNVIYFIITLIVQGFGRSFDINKHKNIVQSWNPEIFPTVDIFLPICGEDIRIIKNTWEGVAEIRQFYKGKLNVYCLDDKGDNQIKNMAYDFKFNYLSREDKGYYKKAGNLLHGYQNSSGEFIVIFDADFRPREDFLNELLPYFFVNNKLGIVQSPQYFDSSDNQVWLERGAGAVQEYFYRSVQQGRQKHGGAICVGSNAIYRRAALDSNKGTTLIEHSEDVHTGFDVQSKGWELIYIPLILAKGACPSDLKGFFRQQYRWCKGSMSLLTSNKFWNTRLPILRRLCYMTGFFYYIQTGLLSIVAPLIPLALLYIAPEQAKLSNYIPLIPSILFNLVIIPRWHKSIYTTEVLSIKFIYGWAHLIAIVDTIRNHNMEWHPTGSKSKRSVHYSAFGILIICFSFSTSLLWISTSLYKMLNISISNFLPVFLSGLLYLFVVWKVIEKATRFKRNIKNAKLKFAIS